MLLRFSAPQLFVQTCRPVLQRQHPELLLPEIVLEQGVALEHILVSPPEYVLVGHGVP